MADYLYAAFVRHRSMASLKVVKDVSFVRVLFFLESIRLVRFVVEVLWQRLKSLGRFRKMGKKKVSSSYRPILARVIAQPMIQCVSNCGETTNSS